jgi:hypothetical protein
VLGKADMCKKGLHGGTGRLMLEAQKGSCKREVPDSAMLIKRGSHVE